MPSRINLKPAPMTGTWSVGTHSMEEAAGARGSAEAGTEVMGRAAAARAAEARETGAAARGWAVAED